MLRPGHLAVLRRRRSRGPRRLLLPSSYLPRRRPMLRPRLLLVLLGRRRERGVLRRRADVWRNLLRLPMLQRRDVLRVYLSDASTG